MQAVAQTNLLFVYGTLASVATGTLGAAQRARLRREGRVLGPAMVAGRLLDLGSYPGLVDPRPWSALARARRGVVHGELHELNDPALTFPWLDPYEGITPGCRGGCEYRRDVLEIALASAPLRKLDAHAYVFQGATAKARNIVDGRWTARPK